MSEQNTSTTETAAKAMQEDSATPPTVVAAKKEEKKGEKKGEKKTKIGRANKREARDIGQFYDWQSGEQIVALLKPSFDDEQFNTLSQHMNETSETYGVLLEDILHLPANVMNQREIEKLRQVKEKYAELRANAEGAIENLLASARVNQKQREAKELRDELAAQRKQRRDAAKVKK